MMYEYSCMMSLKNILTHRCYEKCLISCQVRPTTDSPKGAAGLVLLWVYHHLEGGWKIGAMCASCLFVFFCQDLFDMWPGKIFLQSQNGRDWNHWFGRLFFNGGLFFSVQMFSLRGDLRDPPFRFDCGYPSTIPWSSQQNGEGIPCWRGEMSA